MDSSTITASITVVLQLSDQVLNHLNAVKDAPEECLQCTVEISHLYSLLINMKYRLMEGGASLPWYSNAQALAIEHGPLDLFKETLEALQTETTYFTEVEPMGEQKTTVDDCDSVRFALPVQALVWKCTTEKMSSIMAKVDQLKFLVDFILQKDHFELTQDLEDNAMLPGHDTIEHCPKEQDPVEYQKLLDWISLKNYTSQHMDILRCRLEGTGQWFLETPEITEWLDGPRTNFACTGIPGSGKTMLAAITIDHLLKSTLDSPYGVAYAYGHYKSQDEDACDMLAAILKQLIQGRPSMAEHVQRLYKKHTNQRRRLSLEDIVKPLKAILAHYTAVYVVIDAMDEIPASTRKTLLCTLRDLQLIGDIRLMFTSRLFADIFDDLPQAILKLDVLASKDDVKRYVSSRMHRVPKFLYHEDTLRKTAQEKITLGVGGRFLLARMHLDSLLSKRTTEEVELFLTKPLKGTAGLEYAYREALQRIESKPDRDRALAKQVLSWITFARRQLTTAEILCALSIDSRRSGIDPTVVPGIDTLVSVCAGLVVVDQESGIIRLLHRTAQDYLEDCEYMWSHTAQQAIQLGIAETCLHYLSMDTFKSGSCSSDEELERKLRQNVFLDYAGIHWSEHARSLEPKVSSLVLPFLSDHTLVSSAAQVSSASSHRYGGCSEAFSVGTSLHYTARWGLFQTMKQLLSKPSEEYLSMVNSKDGLGRTPLYIASHNGHTSLVSLLLKHDVDTNAKGEPCGSALSAAAKAGNVQVVKLLLEAGADVNTCDKNHGSALSAAAKSGNVQVVKLLLEAGADVNTCDKNHESALSAAAKAGNSQVVEQLLSARARVEAQNGISQPNSMFGRTTVTVRSETLQTASYNGDFHAVFLLLRGGVRINSSRGYYGHALQAACHGGHEDIVELLLGQGANVNAQGGQFGSALQAASCRGHLHLVYVLLLNGANTYSRGGQYGSALRAAYIEGYGEIIHILQWASARQDRPEPSTHTISQERTIPSLNPLLRFIGHGGFSKSSLSLRFECEILAAVSPRTWTEAELRSTVVIVSSRIITEENSNIQRMRALTCSDYIEQKWGSLGQHLLEDISNLCAMETGSEYQNGADTIVVYKSRDELRFDYSLKFAGSYLVSHVGKTIGDQELSIFIDVLDWLCRAIRTLNQKPLSRGHFISASSYRLLPSDQNSTPKTGHDPTLSEVCLEFSLHSKPLPEVQHNCWQNLFLSCFVLEDEDRTYAGPIGKGLEVSFELMITLAAIEYPVIVSGGVVLAGYRTALIPTQLEPSYAQFHLETNEGRQINPFDLGCDRRIRVTDWTQFKSMRCFIGWCELANIHLGTSSLPLTIAYSGAKIKEKSFEWNGVSVGAHIGSSSPLQAGITGQTSFSIVSHLLSFTPDGDYLKLLADTSEHVVLIFDVHERRSWLVPKLSLMLHMAHIWIAKKGSLSRSTADHVPFARPHDDPKIVKEILNKCGKVPVCGEGEGAYPFSKLLLGFSINLLKSVNNTSESRSKYLYGFELMDLIMEPGRGTHMKELKIAPTQSWLALANLADAVVFCAKLGEAITPAHNSSPQCKNCSAIPKERDYLAAHMSCLRRFSDRAGYPSSLGQRIRSRPLSWPRRVLWNVSGKPYESCTDEDRRKNNCWDSPNMLQKIVLEYNHPVLSSRPIDSAFVDLNTLGTKGAVVFGHKGDKM